MLVKGFDIFVTSRHGAGDGWRFVAVSNVKPEPVHDSVTALVPADWTARCGSGSGGRVVGSSHVACALHAKTATPSGEAEEETTAAASQFVPGTRFEAVTVFVWHTMLPTSLWLRVLAVTVVTFVETLFRATSIPFR